MQRHTEFKQKQLEKVQMHEQSDIKQLQDGDDEKELIDWLTVYYRNNLAVASETFKDCTGKINTINFKERWDKKSKKTKLKLITEFKDKPLPSLLADYLDENRKQLKLSDKLSERPENSLPISNEQNIINLETGKYKKFHMEYTLHEKELLDWLLVNYRENWQQVRNIFVTCTNKTNNIDYFKEKWCKKRQKIKGKLVRELQHKPLPFLLIHHLEGQLEGTKIYQDFINLPQNNLLVSNEETNAYLGNDALKGLHELINHEKTFKEGAENIKPYLLGSPSLIGLTGENYFSIKQEEKHEKDKFSISSIGFFSVQNDHKKFNELGFNNLFKKSSEGFQENSSNSIENLFGELFKDPKTDNNVNNNKVYISEKNSFLIEDDFNNIFGTP